MKRTTLFVIILHVALLLPILFFHPPEKQTKKPMTVRTSTLPPSPPTTTQTVAAQPPKAQSSQTVKPKTTTTTTPKKVVQKQPAQVVKKTPPKQNKQPFIDQKLQKQLQESIAKIEQTSHKGGASNALTVPKAIVQLDVETTEQTSDSQYASALVQCLQSELGLPEKGAVKVELRLKKEGGFIGLSILETKSGRNSTFLQETLPLVQYPPFTKDLEKKKEHTFVVTFCNH